MYPKRRNSIILLLILGISTIPFFLGITTVQAQGKVTFKIQKEGKKAAEPLKKPMKGKEVTVDIEDKAKATYFYDPTNKIDPFKSFIVARRELQEKKQEKSKTYLETVDISQLTISAIVLGSKGRWALVRDSKGDGHVIKVGTLIGRKNGRVKKILGKEVVVAESYKDIRGHEKVQDISMKLPSKD